MLKEIVKYPNKKLTQPTEYVKEINKDILTLIDDLIYTMYAENGLGISAPQIGRKEKIFVVDNRFLDHPEPVVFINPTITRYGQEKEIGKEGCLSYPLLFVDVKRSKEIDVMFQNKEGENLLLTAKGLLARVIQHEHDHLIGKTLIDHASFLVKRSINRVLK